MIGKYLINDKNDYLFSVIITSYNVERYLKDAILSVVNQSLNFMDNVEIIIVDDGSEDSSVDIANSFKKEFPNNIKILTSIHKGQSYCRNYALSACSGEYICFLDADDYYSENTLESVYDCFKNNSNIDICVIPMKYFEKVNKYHLLYSNVNPNKIINLDDDPNNPLVSVCNTFIKKELIDNTMFNETLRYDEGSLFINLLLLKNKQYAWINDCTYYCRQHASNDSLTDQSILDKYYYTDRLVNYHKYIINESMDENESIPKFIEYLLAYDIQNIIHYGNLAVLNSKEDVNFFWNTLNYIISFIDSNVIIHNNNILNPIRPFFVYLKNKSYSIELNEDNEVLLNSGSYLIDKLNRHKIYMDIIDIQDDMLLLSGLIQCNFNLDSISIKLYEVNSKTFYTCDYLEYVTPDRSTLSYLGIKWRFTYNFNVKVNLKDLIESQFKFYVYFDENNVHASFNPEIVCRLPSNLSLPSVYMKINNYIIFHDSKSISITDYTFFKMFKMELRNLSKIIQSDNDNKFKAVFYRMLYLILYPFMKNKNIWIINDRLERADENGIHLFKYINDNHKDADAYYILDKSCEDYNLLKKDYHNIIAYGGFKHKILYLFSKKRVSSFLNEAFFNPFYNLNASDDRLLYNNLITSPRYFIQHGVIYRNLTRHVKRCNHNLRLIVTSSEIERNSFFDLKYGFDEEIVQILGLARYDNLNNNNVKKQILFAPTWRLQFDTSESVFKSSDYYRMLENFLNDITLFNLLEEYGYEMVFKPHPQLVKYLDSLKMNENVIISTQESYQVLLNESSLMISDFSSVVSDFAYLKKPIIYYQLKDDHHFEAYFDYAKDGFGDVLKNQKSVIDKIEYYLKNDCKMENKYIERVNNFFKFNDRNNCKRLYEWISNH
ncbi:MAG: glycosyltransferase [Methanosphaera stadtmanae]|jgi:CDP-glycerol glycerophosphotransferase (TagB/SpsB family)/glycosyltransferase involved in cell wall biosynthesis|nr:glycosyltransferase [Methanosphaera stadtmanae]